MAEASRLSTATGALSGALNTLADALAQARPEAAAASEAEIEARVRDFRAAASIAVAAGEPLSALDADQLRLAMQRCRRLGVSLTLLSAPFRVSTDAPHAYSPVGHTVAPSSEGAYLTARG